MKVNIYVPILTSFSDLWFQFQKNVTFFRFIDWVILKLGFFFMQLWQFTQVKNVIV